MAAKNVAYNTDCLEAIKRMPDECIGLVVTSPPYDNLRTYNGYTFDWKDTITEIYRVIKDGGVVVWIVADQTKGGSESGTSFRQALWARECGFNIHDTMIWDKGTCAFPDTNRYANVFEYMFVLSKGKPKTVNLICDKPNKWAGGIVHGTERQTDGTIKNRSAVQTAKRIKEYGARTNLWNITPEKKNKTGHPAVFPVDLARDHILTWSNKGDVVMDPFPGSGTTRIAAYDLGRQFIGYEIDREYFVKQEQRFSEHINQAKRF